MFGTVKFLGAAQDIQGIQKSAKIYNGRPFLPNVRTYTSKLIQSVLAKIHI